MEKIAFIILFSLFLSSCSGGSGGSSSGGDQKISAGAITTDQVLQEQIQVVNQKLDSNYDFSKEELNDLLAQSLINQEQYNSLVMLTNE